jgi:hypothetical protein
MSLQTPDKIRTLQRKLYLKAKAEPDFRFYLLYDKIYREDVLRHAYDLMRGNNGAPGVAERLIHNLAHRLEQVAPGVAGSILEGLDEMLTVVRLGLPLPLRRSLACTNIIENMMGTIRRVCRNVQRGRDASMALRWTAAAMQDGAKGF